MWFGKRQRVVKLEYYLKVPLAFSGVIVKLVE